MSERFEAIDDRSVILFKLASERPEALDALTDLFSQIAHEYFSDFPRNSEEKVKYETSCYVAHTMRVITKRISEEIEIGKRLSSDTNEGAEDDGQASGHTRRRV